MSKYDIEELTSKIMDKDVKVQFDVAGSCTDYNFFVRMPLNIREDEVITALVQMPDDVIEEIMKKNNITLDRFKVRKDGHCPHCGHNCEDEYKGIKSRLINELYYDTVQCSKCGKTFDRVYKMVLLTSQTTLSTKRILKGEK